MKSHSLLTIVCLLMTAPAFAQMDPPLRDEGIIKSKLFFLENEIQQGEVFLSEYKNNFGYIEKKVEAHKLTSESVLAKEAEILAKKKKTGQENAFVKIAPCLKEVLSLKYKSSGWDADNVSDCYIKNKINPNTFRQSTDGKLLYNKTQIHEAGDELSKLIDLVEDNTPSKESFGLFEKLKSASEMKKKLEGGELEKLKNAQTFLNQEYVHVKKIEFKVNMKLKENCSDISLDLKKQSNSSEGSSSIMVAQDLLNSLSKESSQPIELPKDINAEDVCAAFQEIAKKASCSDSKSQDKIESCEKEKTDLEKIVGHNPVCSSFDEKSNKLLGINCSTIEASRLVQNKDAALDKKKIKKLITTELIQELVVGVKFENEKSTLVGMKESSGVCGYLLKDNKKKELTWISEDDFVTKMKELNILERTSRPQDTYEKLKE